MSEQDGSELAALEAEVTSARNELYVLQASYASEHFKLQSAMRTAELERLSGSAIEGAISVLRAKCEQFEREIDSLRAILKAAGIDPERPRS